MKKILSLPPNLVGKFNALTGLKADQWFATTDPHGVKVGSGGGTAWALSQDCQACNAQFDHYISSQKHIVIHAGGQSRRLPAYAPSGKVLTPVPVFRWSHGQSITQNLLSLQVPMYEAVMQRTSSTQNTLVASGDVFIYADELPENVPEADVVCYGIWTSPQAAANHGVFFTQRDKMGELDFMLQKPSHAEIERLALTHLFLMDVGMWILSDRAVQILMRKCGWNGHAFHSDAPTYYDLYSTFGLALGNAPQLVDNDINSLSVAIVTLEGGEFYHFGTSAEMISSTERVQNRIVDQRNIWHKKVKAHASIFVQNAECQYAFSADNQDVWIENSYVGGAWQLTRGNIITGVPQNNWSIKLLAGQCLDVVPVGDDDFCIRPYAITDKFKGAIADQDTTLLATSFFNWLKVRQISPHDAALDEHTDIQSAKIFPVVHDIDEGFVRWLFTAEGDYKNVWLSARRLSADEISAEANLERLLRSRHEHLKKNVAQLSVNHAKSVFYQTDLKHTAAYFAENNIALPPALAPDEPAMTRMRDMMFRSEVLRTRGLGQQESAAAFSILHQTIATSLTSAPDKPLPRCNVYSDQIVWARSPARLDIAGGWTDTPPHCMHYGGNVVNIAVELNGQPPIQVYIRLSNQHKIVMRSIDNGVMEEIETFDDLADYNKVGSAFSIPKAALCLAGFHPAFCLHRYNTLAEQLQAFGGGMEITQLVAIPKGSGLGTSSILAATLLGALADFCALGWDQKKICHATLVLEQLLTTGGGWQDQYGGIFSGVKMLESVPGNQSDVVVKWLPENLFTSADYSERWLLYYTGITRVAKNILEEIVRGMFLNENARLQILTEMKRHAHRMANAIQLSDFQRVGALIRRSWQLNCNLDPGTTTPEIEHITRLIDPYALGYKLLGAGGGGYMLICARDNASAAAIKQTLTQHAPNDRARFVQMTISKSGLQISRS